MRSTGSVLRSVALILLLCNVTARPGIRHIDYGALYGRSYDDTILGGDSRKIANPMSVAAHIPSKRMMPGITPIVRQLKLNMFHFVSIRPIVPIHKAALFLEDFYAQVALSAGGVWSQSPRRYNFAIREGNFELTFRSLGDSIPWEVVKDLAERLWECAVMGLTDLFEAAYSDETGKIALKVTMSIVDASLSSSDDDFREGSVPSVNGPEDMSYQQDGP
ncbi:MAG: hypothetical protein HETSPECPRED_001127 [Heterodermia speciosa]|uniref:Uncharacterized protein n=1 Tax=Heterodermia speciosa TaxID=116794 RepID=A0A8H3J0U1_9LECA|nr:MAG: hypothetical protein HETSPECPRED_001127 [Heterodermia speciosa]